MIYKPAEDSYLLEKVLREFLKDKNKNINIIDIGSGSGIQTQACIDLGFKNVLAIDVNPNIITYLKENKLNVIKSDLFSNIDNQNKFDIIIFNPPYLPEDLREPEESKLATTAGKQGYEIIIRFLEESKHYLSKNGKILLLFSTLSQPEVILNKIIDLGYKNKLVKSLKLDFEELFVYELSL